MHLRLGFGKRLELWAIASLTFAPVVKPRAGLKRPGTLGATTRHCTAIGRHPEPGYAALSPIADGPFFCSRRPDPSKLSVGWSRAVTRCIGA